MSIGSSSEPVRLHAPMWTVSVIRSLFFSALHFLRPVVSSLRLYPPVCRFAKQVLLYSGRLPCNLLFSSKGEGRVRSGGPSSSEKNENCGARSHRRRRCDYHTDAGFIVLPFLSQFRRDDEKRDLRRRSFCEERIKPFIQRQRAMARQRRLFLQENEYAVRNELAIAFDPALWYLHLCMLGNCQSFSTVFRKKSYLVLII